MENKERDMGPTNKRKRKIRRPSKARDRLKIIIFRKAGKVRTFEISARFLLWVSLFFITYIVATIILTNLFIDYYRDNKILADQNAELETILVKTKKSLEESKQHIALLDDYITKQREQDPMPLSKENHTESSFADLVDIDELKVERNKSIITVDFQIINKQANEEPIGGYIFVLARIKGSNKSEVWVYPNSQLKDGLPVNYRSGERFFIQRFKSIGSKYTINKTINRPLIFEILAYDRDGKLILKKLVEE